jgi:predicted O-methyltransferase YrrM
MNRVFSMIKATQKGIQFKKDYQRLKSSHNLSISYLAKAIERYVDDQLTDQERAWIEKIEEIRDQMNVSEESLALNNFTIPESEHTDADFKYQTMKKVCLRDSKPKEMVLLLFLIIREFDLRNALELGTCLGVSASYQASALVLNGDGKLITLDGTESKAQKAQSNWQTLGLENIESVVGNFQNTLQPILDNQKKFDYVYIDGHHEKQPTLDYFDQIYPYLSKRSIVVFDDISWSKGMEEAWEIIKKDGRIKVSLDVHDFGVCVCNIDVAVKQNFNIPLFSYIPKMFR